MSPPEAVTIPGGDPFTIRRRHFIAVATSEYDAGEGWALPGVVHEVTKLRAWLCAASLGERMFTPLYPDLANSPSEDAIRAALRNPNQGWTHDDAVVVFVTGHGDEVNDRHMLLLKETDVTYPADSAIASADLISWLARYRSTPMLFIFDLCHAGAAAKDTIRFDKPFPQDWLVVASVTKHQQAYTGALTGVVTDILADLDTAGESLFGNEPYLDAATFLGEVQRRLHLRGQDLVPLNGQITPTGPHPCLPNPRYRPDELPPVQPTRRDLAIRIEDQTSHWGPRARGVARDSDLRWLFTGRGELMRELIAAATGAPGAVVVTGSAGCGKSAVLSRLVTLSDPTFRDRYREHLSAVPADQLPPDGAVDVAVLATGKVAEEVMAQICAALQVPIPDGSSQRPRLAVLQEAWRTWRATRAEPVTIVVDALDEATHPVSVLTDVLTQLDAPDPAHARVRLIVGVRSVETADPTAPVDQRNPPLADHAERVLSATRLRVDQPPWRNTTDVADYARQLLLTHPDSPYRSTDTSVVDTVAGIIANKSGTSYLVARLSATSLAERGSVIDPQDQVWLDSLDAGVVGVFRDDLHTTLLDPLEREKAIHLLRAVAFAYGRGLPWYLIWPRVANAVANHPERTYGDADIAWLLQTRLAGYLVTDVEDDTTVYRLFHHALRETLRTRWHDLVGPS
jgi:hypothetical protein